MSTCATCKEEVQADAAVCPSCGAAPAASAAPDGATPGDPYVGRTVAQKYKVHQLLDRGGMGQVYKATDLRLDRPVALKMLNAALLADPTVVQRFHREARAASRLNHPNSISIIDFGQAEDGVLYLAMEYVPGRSLTRLIAEEFPLDTARVVKIGSQILAALTEAHALGVLHCDLKSDNVMVESRHDETDVVKVLDFGIAKLAEGGPRLTQAGTVCGTPGYMSPEQAHGQKLDSRSDLYSVGVILYELVTGKQPFEAATPIALITRMLAERPPRPSVRRPDLNVPVQLEALIMRALSLEREERPASAEEFRRELLACTAPEARAAEPVLKRQGTVQIDAATSPFGTEATRAIAGLEPRPTPRQGRTASSRIPTPSRVPKRYQEIASALPVMIGSVAGALVLGALLVYGLTRSPGGNPNRAGAEEAGKAESAAFAVRDVPNSLPTPPASSGEGILTLVATPGARISVDGQPVGDTTRELRLAEGAHRIGASHPGLGTAQETVEVVAGQRKLLNLTFRK